MKGHLINAFNQISHFKKYIKEDLLPHKRKFLNENLIPWRHYDSRDVSTTITMATERVAHCVTGGRSAICPCAQTALLNCSFRSFFSSAAERPVVPIPLISNALYSVHYLSPPLCSNIVCKCSVRVWKILVFSFLTSKLWSSVETNHKSNLISCLLCR